MPRHSPGQALRNAVLSVCCPGSFIVCKLSNETLIAKSNIINGLLVDCLSFKVKRLFLHLVDDHQLPCFKHIDQSKINLGIGKRTIGKGGHYIKKYMLAVPKISGEYYEDFTDV
ncbi:MAG: hypothetical protein CMF50_07180 [Legionellales bacterium]|nr:hypothetical protein [Legionellales bacterium]